MNNIIRYNSINNLWDFMIRYFNNNYNKNIKRKDMIDFIRNEYTGNKANITTIDCYRNILTKARYLEIIKRGVYKVVKNIPIFTSVKDVIYLAYKKRKIDALYIIENIPIFEKREFIKKEEFNI